MGSIFPITSTLASINLTNIEETNDMIEKILEDLKEQARELIIHNDSYFQSIIKYLIKNKKINQDQFYNIAKNYIKDLTIVPNDYKIVNNYEKLLNEYFDGKVEK